MKVQNGWPKNLAFGCSSGWTKELKSFNPFDVLASHYIIDASAIISETLNARLEIHLDDTIKENDSQTFKQYLLCDHEAGYPVKLLL